MALTKEQALARARARLRAKQKAPKAAPAEDFERPSMEWGADLVTSRKPTDIQEALTGATLGVAGGTLKGVGAVTQLATGGRAGTTIGKAGEKASELGGKVAPVSTFVGELAAPVAGVKKASQLMKLAEKGESFIRKALKAAGIGAVAAPAALPVIDADQMSVSDFYSEKGQQAAIGAIGGAALFGAGKVAGASVSKLMDIVGNRTVKQAREIIEKYRVKTLEDLSKAVKLEDQKLVKTQSQREQIAAGESKREARAQAKVTPGAPKERERVLDITRERERAAQQALADAETRSVAANDAIADLETRLASGVPKERVNFGAAIRNIAQKIKTVGEANREKVSKFSQVVDESPAEPIIPTTAVATSIRKMLKDINNPVEQRLFVDIEKRLGKDVKKLNVRQADSLKTYLNNIIETNVHIDRPLSKDIVNKVIQLRNELVTSLKDNYAPYANAMEAYGPASRPLDIVERNGALKKVVDKDPLTSTYKLTESEVVGAAIRKAQAGNKLFERLLSESPDLQESARLYFTRDLLGRGSPPSPAAFKTWLGKNENVLRQLKLYDEFSSLANARKAADRSVKVAKGLAEEATGFREKAVKYVERAAKATEPAEKLKIPAVKRAEARAGELEKEELKIGKSVKALRDIDSRLRAAEPEDVPGIAKSFVEKLRVDGSLNDQQYQDMLSKVNNIEKTVKLSNRAEAIRNLFIVGVGSSILGGSAIGYLLRGGPATPPTPLPE